MKRAEEIIRELEDRSTENIQSEEQKDKGKGKINNASGTKKKTHRTNRWDNIKQFNIQAIGVPGTRTDKTEQKTY